MPEKFVKRGIEMARNYRTIILGAYIKMSIESGTLKVHKQLINFVKELYQIDKNIILISFGNPYFIKQVPYAKPIYVLLEIALPYKG